MTEEVKESAAPAEPTPVTVVEEKAPSIDDTMNAVFDKLNPPRETTGQFKSAAPEAAPEQVSEQEPVEAKAEPAKPAIPRPQSYSADVDQWWSELPPERQEFLSKR